MRRSTSDLLRSVLRFANYFSGGLIELVQNVGDDHGAGLHLLRDLHSDRQLRTWNEAGSSLSVLTAGNQKRHTYSTPDWDFPQRMADFHQSLPPLSPLRHAVENLIAEYGIQTDQWLSNRPVTTDARIRVIDRALCDLPLDQFLSLNTAILDQLHQRPSLARRTEVIMVVPPGIMEDQRILFYLTVLSRLGATVGIVPSSSAQHLPQLDATVFDGGACVQYGTEDWLHTQLRVRDAVLSSSIRDSWEAARSIARFDLPWAVHPALARRYLIGA